MELVLQQEINSLVKSRNIVLMPYMAFFEESHALYFTAINILRG